MKPKDPTGNLGSIKDAIGNIGDMIDPSKTWQERAAAGLAMSAAFMEILPNPFGSLGRNRSFVFLQIEDYH